MEREGRQRLSRRGLLTGAAGTVAAVGAGGALLRGVGSRPAFAETDAERLLSSLPSAPREFRAAWVASVANIDWPSKPALPVEQQKAELLAILDQAAALHLNAIVLQVRPECDALYESKLEPWSEYLTGQQGKAPDPYYDPLELAVTEAHKRGLELHAWFNPYRARHRVAKSPQAPNHLAVTRPDLTKSYGSYLWLDPGEPDVQAHSLAVMLDVAKRYDVDGIHMDDYFYPYKEKDPAGNALPFPDDPSWSRYVKSGGKLKRDDWRRDNVNRFVERLYDGLKREKKHVKLGISPFGIWRPGHPRGIVGFDQYAELYADAKKWLVEGWCDYFTPQLYWKIDSPGQSYPKLLGWWTKQNPKRRHLWPGNYTSQVTEGGKWPAEEIVNQIGVTRSVPGAEGNVHFSMKSLMPGKPLGDALLKGPYAGTALVPASPWLDKEHPGTPTLGFDTDQATGKIRVAWASAGAEEPRVWLVQTRSAGKWTTEVVPLDQRARVLAGDFASVDAIAVSAVDRNGNQSRPAAALLKR